MRNLLMGLALVVSAAAQADVIRLSEPVSNTETTETFANAPVEFDAAAAVSLANLLDDAEALAGKQIVVQTRVAKVCQKKGCFFIAQQGAHSVRVSFKDYGFFVPTDSGGKEVTLLGELVEREVSEAEARHFAEDLGGAEVPAGKRYEIVASAVRIPR